MGFYMLCTHYLLHLLGCFSYCAKKLKWGQFLDVNADLSTGIFLLFPFFTLTFCRQLDFFSWQKVKKEEFMIWLVLLSVIRKKQSQVLVSSPCEYARKSHGATSKILKPWTSAITWLSWKKLSHNFVCCQWIFSKFCGKVPICFEYFWSKQLWNFEKKRNTITATIVVTVVMHKVMARLCFCHVSVIVMLFVLIIPFNAHCKCTKKNSIWYAHIFLFHASKMISENHWQHHQNDNVANVTEMWWLMTL